MSLATLQAGVRLALATTVEHKTRSFLTILGVIIGTGAVIGVGSIIAGLDGAITNLIGSFGPNTVIVTKTPAMGNRLPRSAAASHCRSRTRGPSATAVLRCRAISPYLIPPNGGIHGEVQGQRTRRHPDGRYRGGATPPAGPP